MRPILVLILLATPMLVAAAGQLQPGLLGQQADRWWGDAVQSRLVSAGQNKSELVHALSRTAKDQRAAIAFVIENMPQRDLQSLTADFLVTEVQKACEIQDKATWKIPEDLFLNYVLPYANVDEPR